MPVTTSASAVPRQRLVMVDDHQLLLDGLLGLMNQLPQLEVVGTFTSSLTAAVAIPQLAPDLLLVDLDMPELTGPELIRKVKLALPNLRTVVLSMHLDPLTAKRLLAMGIDGYLLKSEDSADFIQGLAAVARGKRYYASRVTESLHQTIATGSTTYAQRVHLLTPREREVLQQVAEGLTSKEIASALHVSMSTVETHRKALLSKLEVKNVAGLVRVALREGLV